LLHGKRQPPQVTPGSEPASINDAVGAAAAYPTQTAVECQARSATPEIGHSAAGSKVLPATGVLGSAGSDDRAVGKGEDAVVVDDILAECGELFGADTDDEDRALGADRCYVEVVGMAVGAGLGGSEVSLGVVDGVPVGPTLSRSSGPRLSYRSGIMARGE
jgi:hypothetical protein